ncbi:hypothetical protein EDD85DRAFT_959549 [Armillaria nabsnona]|nr:hypothetical protein EDD85DRAFT_959549 [Armillaria nabsnona]
MEFYLSVAVACIAETLVIWDYLISIDDEVALFWACSKFIKIKLQLSEVLKTVLKSIVDRVFVLSESLPWDISPNLGFAPYVISELVAFQLLHSLLPKSFDTTWIFTYVDCPTARSWKGACYMFINPDGMLYAGIQLIVMESIMVVRAWAIMGRQHRVLWTFVGLLTFSTIASLVMYILPLERADNTYYFYFLPTVVLEAILFAVVAYHAIKYRRHSRSLQLSCAGTSQPRIRLIMRLMFEDSILYFVIIIAVLMIVPFLKNSLPLCMSVASITVTRMLLHLRKQALFDSAGPTSVQGELSTFRVRAVSEGINSEAEEDRSL